jgi:Response regulators consisting of a CheY-like receiver domain and a winged-helix DNA-binding domain
LAALPRGTPGETERRDMMKKLIIADRADILVNEIFNHHSQYSGLTVAFGAVLYTVQIYADFSGMVHIRKLRVKVEETPQEPQHIKTVWGRGYRFE